MDPIQQAQLLALQGQTIPADLQRQVFQQAAANNMTSAQLEQLFNMPAGTAAQAAQQLGIANQIPQQLGGIPRDNFGNDLNSGAAEAAQAGMDAFAAQGASTATVQPPSTPQYTQAQIDSVVNALNTGQTTPEQVAQQYGVTADEVRANLAQINVNALPAINRAGGTGMGALVPLKPSQQDVDTVVNMLNSGQVTPQQVADNYGVSVDEVNRNLKNANLASTLSLPQADGDYTQDEINQVTKLLQDGKLSTADAANFFNVPEAQIQNNLAALTNNNAASTTVTNAAGGAVNNAGSGGSDGATVGAGGGLPDRSASGTYSVGDTMQVANAINSGQLTLQQASDKYGVPVAEIEANLKTINANNPQATSLDVGDMANQSGQFNSTGMASGLAGSENIQASGLSNALQATQRGTNVGSNLIGLGATDAASVIGKQYFQNQGMFDPYRVGGESALQKQLALSGALGKEAFDAAYQASPQMQFLQDRGERAVARNAAAIGGLGGGNVQRELAKFSQGLASQDLQNQIGNLQALSGTGMDASQQAATLGTRGAESMADIYGQRAIRQADLASRGADNAANYIFRTGQQMGADRMTTGRDIARTAQDTSAALARLQQQQGTGISQLYGDIGSNLQGIMANAGATAANQINAAAANRVNAAQNMGANAAALIGGVPQRGQGYLQAIGDAAAGVGTAVGGFKMAGR
tara:strand:+ start:24309 stop:26399 length:2091 start_codon:yes stop_codon:yes gene_type:complete